VCICGKKEKTEAQDHESQGVNQTQM